MSSRKRIGGQHQNHQWVEGVLTRTIKGFTVWKKGTKVLVMPVMVGGGYHVKRKNKIGDFTICNQMAGCPPDAIEILSLKKS